MDPLTIQAMKNRQTNQLRVFNKQEDVDRIYGHRPFNRSTFPSDEEDIVPTFQVVARKFDQQMKIELETADLQRNVRVQRRENNDEKIKEEEQKLKLAQKLHQTAMEEMEIERLNIEKLLEEKKKLLNGVEPCPAPPLPAKKEEEEEEEQDSISCVVCMDAKRTILCDPCLHVVLCLECSRNMNQCPMCMAPATMKRIFLA